MTLPLQLNNKQMDPTNAFVEKERQSSERQWAMENVKSVSKNLKTSAFFDKKLAEKKLAQNITARRSTEWCSID